MQPRRIVNRDGIVRERSSRARVPARAGRRQSDAEADDYPRRRPDGRAHDRRHGVGVGPGAAKATLNVVHGIPGLDVDVCVNGAKAITDFNPGEVVAGVKLPAGTYHLAVVAAGTTCSAEVLAADARWPVAATTPWSRTSTPPARPT